MVREPASVDTLLYLVRIGLGAVPPVDRGGLETLQRAHLTAVPFENLDVYARRGVQTGLDWSVPKIVERRRGGWCFELNGGFSSLLTALGFEVKRRGAAVITRGSSDEPTHLTLEVTLDVPYLVDVGFGDTFIKPLRLDVSGPQDGGCGEFVIETDGDDTTLFRFDDDGSLLPQYRFGPDEWSLADFDGASGRLQSEPGLSWTESPFATRLLDGGPDRVTLLKDRLRFRRKGEWSEEAVADEDWSIVLDRWFGLTP